VIGHDWNCTLYATINEFFSSVCARAGQVCEDVLDVSLHMLRTKRSLKEVERALVRTQVLEGYWTGWVRCKGVDTMADDVHLQEEVAKVTPLPPITWFSKVQVSDLHITIDQCVMQSERRWVE